MSPSAGRNPTSALALVSIAAKRALGFSSDVAYQPRRRGQDRQKEGAAATSIALLNKQINRALWFRGV